MRKEIHINQFRYIKAPTIPQIQKVIDAYGVDYKQFGRFFGIENPSYMWHIMQGIRKLPVSHWHIVYECLKLLDEGKELPVYREDIPEPPKDPRFLSLFKESVKKRTPPKKHKIQRKGSLCELC